MGATYQQAVDYIEEIPRFTTKNSLDHTRDCLRRLGDPQKSFRVIHVAGTNGKGSTCAFLDSVLRQAGYACGLFTSPHLVSVKERFMIGGKMVEDALFLNAFERVKTMVDELILQGLPHPSYFEFLFLMGALIFADSKRKIVVLETGLGGRLDATTAISDPLICVITSISMDHMQYLGNTLEEIAGEKAGIIVPEVPVVYDANDPRAAAVIAAKARQSHSQAFPQVWEDACIVSHDSDGINFRLIQDGPEGILFHLPFIARYQVMNASLALKTIRLLRRLPAGNGHFRVSEEEIREGFSLTRWAGRMEKVLDDVVIDGAHNEDGIRRFIETAVYFQKDHDIELLFSAVSDKDYQHMVRQICERLKLKRVTVTQVGGYRQVPVPELAAQFEKNGVQGVFCESDPEKAFCHALEMKGSRSILFCVGSLYLVGLIKGILAKPQEEIV